MSTYEFKLPDIGEGVTEGEIVRWLIATGQVVTEDQPMVEVMTDKATVTITAPRSGKVAEIRGAEGSVVPVHAVLVVFELDGEPSKPAVASAAGDIKETLPGMATSSAPPELAESAYHQEKPLATPATRRLARELGVDLKSVPPSGPNGRVTAGDVRRHTSAPPPATTPKRERLVASETALEREERIPLRGVRRRIFEAMGRSAQTVAHFTFVEECDATALRALRTKLKPEAERCGVKLTYLPFIVKAVVAALRKHPALNSSFDESTQEIVHKRYYDIGIATATNGGLIVPVVRDADRRNVLDIAREIQRLGEECRTGKIRPEDLGGSTFTITSLGDQAGLFATPIVNFPEVAILGIHRMKQKPVVRDGQIVIGDVMLLSLSFDHRLIDGHVGAAFAYEIISYLENPDRLFLELA